jgi:hypothetical protein
MRPGADQWFQIWELREQGFHVSAAVDVIVRGGDLIQGVCKLSWDDLSPDPAVCSTHSSYVMP